MPGGHTFSAGFTTERFRPEVASDLERVMEAADLALYAAKDRGRAVAVSAAAGMRGSSARRRQPRRLLSGTSKAPCVRLEMRCPSSST